MKKLYTFIILTLKIKKIIYSQNNNCFNLHITIFKITVGFPKVQILNSDLLIHIYGYTLYLTGGVPMV